MFVKKVGNYLLISVSSTAVTSRDKRTNNSDPKTREVNESFLFPVKNHVAYAQSTRTERIPHRDDSVFTSHIKDSFKLNDTSLVVDRLPYFMYAVARLLPVFSALFLVISIKQCLFCILYKITVFTE